MAKPRVFIGSSSEGRAIAEALQGNLDGEATCTVWDQGVFPLSGLTVESLLSAAGRFDFALFVLSPDDTAEVRGERVLVARDNVLLEVGLFLGVLPKSQVLLLTPTKTEDCRLKLPSDLDGMTVGSYDSEREDKNWRAATGPFCLAVKERIQDWRTARETTQNTAENRDLRVMSTIRERFSWPPGEQVPEQTNRLAYQPQLAELRIRGGKAEAHGKMVTTGRLEFDGDIVAHGVYQAGVAYMIYTSNDDSRGYNFKGLLLLRVPPMGQPSGVWIADDHIDPGRGAVVIGDISAVPVPLKTARDTTR